MNNSSYDRRDETIRGIKTLVINECANYIRNGPFNTQHYCWKQEKRGKGICVFFQEDRARCPYLENAVLPLDKELQESYRRKETNDGRETQDREFDFGKGNGRVIGNFETVPGEAQKFRGALDCPWGTHILPRPAFHGVAAKKQIAGQRWSKTDAGIDHQKSP